MGINYGDNIMLNGNPYRVISQIGRGILGRVYKVSDISGEVFALKVQEIEGSADDFIKESEVLKKLSNSNCNENVLCIIDYSLDKETNTGYILSEYITGTDLRHVGYFNNSNNIGNYIQQLIKGLHYIHKHNIAHLDIKQANVMLTDDGIIKYVDFGLVGWNC